MHPEPHLDDELPPEDWEWEFERFAFDYGLHYGAPAMTKGSQ